MSEAESDYVRVPKKVFEKILTYVSMIELELADIKKKLKGSGNS